MHFFFLALIHLKLQLYLAFGSVEWIHLSSRSSRISAEGEAERLSELHSAEQGRGAFSCGS